MTKKTNKPLGIGLEALIPKYQTTEVKLKIQCIFQFI